MLRPWLAALRQATLPQIRHFVYFVGEPLPAWWAQEAPPNALALLREEEPGASIGHYHNLGAEQARTRWIMKLDVDAFPNVNYFVQLLMVLEQAKEREWFNGGMFYVNRMCFAGLLDSKSGALSAAGYQTVMNNRRTYAGTSFLGAAGSNFICRREDYLVTGGCDPRFRGYGWEDYQQIYALEWHQRQADPLPGPVFSETVTTRCRDGISRVKAAELLARNPWLCLLHKWHGQSSDASYRTPANMANNRKVLLEYVIGGKR